MRTSLALSEALCFKRGGILAPSRTCPVAVNMTGDISSLHERGHDSCLREGLCYKRLLNMRYLQRLVWDVNGFS